MSSAGWAGSSQNSQIPFSMGNASFISRGFTKVTDRNQHASRTEQHDGFGRTAQVTKHPSSTNSFSTTYKHDPLGNLTLVTDAKGNTTGIFYDALSRKIEISDPCMGDWFYGYDRNGNLTSQTDSKGQTINFQYDPLSRPLCKIYPNQATITYFYDDTSTYTSYGSQTQNYGVGRLAAVVDNSPQNSSGITRFFYDRQGRTTLVSKTIDEVQYNTQFQYDPLGRIINIQYPDNDQVNYGYDPAGNISTVSNINSSLTYAAFTCYNAFGQVGNIAFGNNMSTAFSYEALTNRLHELTTKTPASAVVQNFTYTYDCNGNILKITDNVDQTQTQTFHYDCLNRLTQAAGAYGAQNYNPDPAGNIENPQVAASANEQALVFDYDNRIESMTSGGVSATFVYDYTGARVKKICCANVVTYISKLFEVRNGSVMKHVFAGGRRIATISGSSVYYCHPDHLGSLRIATDAAANQVMTAAYDPYGNVLPKYSSGSAVPYTYTGKELDETGYYYFGARYYDASQGRFITPDGIVQSPRDPQSLNQYAYARNNPLAFVDPTGHGFFSFLEDFFAALFGAAITALTWGAAEPVVAGLLGGMVAGGADAAMHGGSLISIVQGAFFGAIGGAIAGGGFLAGVPWPVMAAGGLAHARRTGGVKGLETFAVGFAGSLAGGFLGDYLNEAISSNIAQAADYQSNMRDMDKGDPASEDSQKAANDQKIADAVNKGLDASGLPQNPANVYLLNDQFAGRKDPSFTDDWASSFTTHGDPRESGAIPGVNPPLDIKYYNDPVLGSIIAPVTPTNSRSHYLDFTQWHFGIGNA
jgi:RHS repeat-associated protein